MNPTGCSDGVKKQLQVVLAESVRQDVLLSFEQQRNHHQRVNVDDEAKDREEPSKSNITLLLMILTRTLQARDANKHSKG